MVPVQSSSHHSTTGPLGLDPVVAGTACCVVSALGYAGSSICMRHLAESCPPMWVVFNKELVTVVVVGPWLLCRAMRGLPVFPSRRALALLIGVALAVQAGANLGVQWALGIDGVGLAVTIPCIFGLMLTTSAVLGWAFLGERVSRRSCGAIGLLLISLAMLGWAANVAGDAKGDDTATVPAAERATAEQPAGDSGSCVVLLAVGAACGAGAIYALLTITIRHTVTGVTPIATVVFVTTLIGVLTLGPLSVCHLGVEKLRDTPPDQLAWMYVAGVLNLVAFLAITKGLELTTVVRVNVLNASQVAMAAVAGWLLFDESLTAWLIVGVSLTIVGIILIDRPRHGDRDADQHV